MAGTLVEKSRFGLVCSAALLFATPGTAFAQDAETVQYGETTNAEEASSGLQLSSGETMTIDLSSVEPDHPVGISVEEESGISFYDAANTAPTCVTATQDFLGVKVTNNCPSPVRVKVVMTGPIGAPDAACTDLEPGAEKHVAKLDPKVITRIDRVENC